MRYVLLIFLCFTTVFSYSQDSTATKLPDTVKGTITSSTTEGPLSDVNIVNINQVVGVATDLLLDHGCSQLVSNTRQTKGVVSMPETAPRALLPPPLYC